MGKLKPHTKYVYERVNDTIYAREFGSDPTERFEIGRDWSTEDQQQGRSLRDRRLEKQLWDDIRACARTNETLQSELDRVIMLYNLVKQENTTDQNIV